MGKKIGFSLAEVLVALALISVIAAILINPIQNSIPDTKQKKFITAVRTVQQLLNELTDDSDLYPDGDLSKGGTATADVFCTNTTAKLNIIGTPNCINDITKNDEPSADEPNFSTTNGLRWWGFNTAFATNPTIIYVDVDGDETTHTLNTDVYAIQVWKSGKISFDSTSSLPASNSSYTFGTETKYLTTK